MEQLTSMCDMVGQYIQKKEEEKQIEEVQAAKARYWMIPVCYDDDEEDYAIAVTPSLSTEEPDNSLNQFEDFSDSNDESTLTDDDSFSIDNIEYVEASPPNSELVSLEYSRNLKTHTEGFCPPVFISSASLGNHVSKSNRANVYLTTYLINGLRFT
nr:hypothetical protein [Tanacetum cinerariifolium]